MTHRSGDCRAEALAEAVAAADPAAVACALLVTPGRRSEHEY